MEHISQSLVVDVLGHESVVLGGDVVSGVWEPWGILLLRCIHLVVLFFSINNRYTHFVDIWV